MSLKYVGIKNMDGATWHKFRVAALKAKKSQAEWITEAGNNKLKKEGG